MTTPTPQRDHILLSIAVIGGTGKEGAGLAARWASVGYKVIIGSRDAARAQQKADELNTALGFSVLQGMDNLSAAHAADVIVVSVPYEAHADTLRAVCDAVPGKIVIDVTVPNVADDKRTVHVPAGKSAAQEAQAILGPAVRVVSAFQNVGAPHLSKLEKAIECDVLVCGDDEKAKEEVILLVQAAGLRGIDAGPLANAVAAESLTPVLMYINKRYKVKGAGIRITGMDTE